VKIKIGKFKYPGKPQDGSEWIHINIYLGKKFTARHYPYLKKFVLLIYTKIYTYIDSGFYLVEGDFLMFAVQLRDKRNINLIERILTDQKKIYLDSGKVDYILKVEIERDTKDYENGEGFLRVMNEAMIFNLLYEDNSVQHLIHCIINSCMVPQIKEKQFYKMMDKML
jgi:hypothetical protein